MVQAYIMVKTAPGSSQRLLEAIREYDGVVEAHIVAGRYDIVTEAERGEVYDVMRSVATGIRDLDGVVDTRTYMCLE